MDQDAHGRREKLVLIEAKPLIGKGGMLALVMVLALVACVALFATTRKPSRQEAITPVDTPQEAASEPQEEDPAVPEEPEEDMKMNVTLVSGGVFYVSFEGQPCLRAHCLTQATEAVLTVSAAGTRIASIAPLGMYGSPSTLVIVTAFSP